MSAADVIGTGKGYQMTDTGIVFERLLTDEELDALGIRIARIANATGWAIGDWLVAGNGRGPGGKSYDRAGQLTGKSYETLSQYARVSAAYAHGERSLAPWSMYRGGAPSSGWQPHRGVAVGSRQPLEPERAR
jgi:hypothetical protein